MTVSRHISCTVKPELKLVGNASLQSVTLGVGRGHVSISHDGEYVTAIVFLEKAAEIQRQGLADDNYSTSQGPRPIASWRRINRLFEGNQGLGQLSRCIDSTKIKEQKISSTTLHSLALNPSCAEKQVPPNAMQVQPQCILCRRRAVSVSRRPFLALKVPHNSNWPCPAQMEQAPTPQSDATRLNAGGSTSAHPSLTAPGRRLLAEGFARVCAFYWAFETNWHWAQHFFDGVVRLFFFQKKTAVVAVVFKKKNDFIFKK